MIVLSSWGGDRRRYLSCLYWQELNLAGNFSRSESTPIRLSGVWRSGCEASATKYQTPNPKFAEMGVVPGNPATGDSVMAYLTPGERVLNAKQQENLFKLIAKGGNFGGGFDYEMLALAISKQPAPRLIYKEFTDFQEKIVTFDEHIKL